MFSTNVKMLEIVKKQYIYKCRAYIQILISLILIQVFSILFSGGSSGSAVGGGSSFNFNIHYYSADTVVAFTMLWGFISSILVTTKAYRMEDFAFVANRLTSGLSNILFLLTASFIGALTAMLSVYFIKDMMFFLRGTLFISTAHSMTAPVEFLLGLFTATLFILLFCALGYFVGTLVQLYRGFIAVPALIIAAFFFAGNLEVNTFLTFVYQFLFKESSALIFAIKTIVSAAVLFGSALALSSRVEVN